MKAPIGALVRIYYDSPRNIEPGHYLQTPTGRTYLILECRLQAKGAHIGRKHLQALVVDHPGEGTVHPIYWYPRGRRRRL